MKKRTDFLYLSEQDTIDAGVLHAARCVDVCEEVFVLLSEGDYLMGGSNNNNHGLYLVFPKESPFPNMPIAGPDRRFAAMPAYLGGRFDICGNKWYGSNAANTTKGLPRSVLTLMLNDKDTGEPITMMSANLLSAARTGAVPGVAARHMTKENAKVCTVIGCGPINRACCEAVISQVPTLEKILCFDLFADKAQEFATWIESTFNLQAEVCQDLETCVRAAEVITVAASRLKPLHIADEWVQKGTLLLVSGPMKADESLWTGSTIVYDHTQLQEAYVEDAIASGDKENYYAGVIGGPLYSLIDAGKLPQLKESIGIGHVIRGKQKGRVSQDDRIIFIACGMAVFDLAWGMEVYNNAVDKNIGQKLLLWDDPYQTR